MGVGVKWTRPNAFRVYPERGWTPKSATAANLYGPVMWGSTANVTLATPCALYDARGLTHVSRPSCLIFLLCVANLTTG